MHLFDVTEAQEGRINYDGAPGMPRSVLVYAFTGDEAAETVRELLVIPDDVELEAVRVFAPRAREDAEMVDVVDPLASEAGA